MNDKTYTYAEQTLGSELAKRSSERLSEHMQSCPWCHIQGMCADAMKIITQVPSLKGN